jgi:hypothetical protein
MNKKDYDKVSIIPKGASREERLSYYYNDRPYCRFCNEMVGEDKILVRYKYYILLFCGETCLNCYILAN